MPEDISNVNDVILIRELQEKGSIDPADLYLLQTTNQSYKLSHDDLVAALPDNTSIEVDPVSNKLKVSDNFLKVDIDLFDGVDQNHGELASSKAIKDYVDAIEVGAGATVYVPINIIENFNQSDGDIITYDIANFTSSDTSFTPSRVVGVYVECYTSKTAEGTGSRTSIESRLGNQATWSTIQKTYDFERATTGGLKLIPLSLGQTSFDLRLVGAAGDSTDARRRGWRILGVSQSTTEIIQKPVTNTTLFKYGEIQVGDIGAPARPLTTTGDFTATKTKLAASSTVTCTFINPLPNNKYNLLFEIISLNNVNDDNDLKKPIVISKSNTGFEFNIDETHAVVQNLQINVRVESNIPSDMGVIQEWEVRATTYAEETWGVNQVNDTGYPLILRAFAQDADDNIGVDIEIDGVVIEFLHDEEDTGTHDDTAEITIPAGATWKLLNTSNPSNTTFDVWKTWTLKTTPVVGSGITTSSVSAKYTRTNGSTNTGGVLGGSWAAEYESGLVVSSNSGVFTLNQAGIYLVIFSGRYSEDNNQSGEYYTVQHRVDGVTVDLTIINENNPFGPHPFNSTHSVYVPSGSKTVDIYLDETGTTTINWYDVSITFIKIG